MWIAGLVFTNRADFVLSESKVKVPIKIDTFSRILAQFLAFVTITILADFYKLTVSVVVFRNS